MVLHTILALFLSFGLQLGEFNSYIPNAIHYETFSQDDYDRFYQQYIQNKREMAKWAVPDFTKTGMVAAGAKHGSYLPRLRQLYHRQEMHGQSFLG